jgi:hypothetical protein
MTTNRTPIQRPALTMITPRAVELYESMGALRCTCLPPPRPPTRGPCPGCAKWYDLHDQLHRELAARPWEWPIVARRSPKRAGSTAWNETIAGTMAQLDEAVRRRRAAAAALPSAGTEQEDTNAEPVAGQDTFT